MVTEKSLVVKRVCGGEEEGIVEVEVDEVMD